MNPSLQQRVIALLALAAGVLVLSSTAFLIFNHLKEQRAAAVRKERLTELRRAVKQDAAAAKRLEQEYKRETDLALRRDRVRERVAWVLIGSAAVFLACAKRLTAMAPFRAYVPDVVREKTARATAARAKADARPPAAGPFPSQLVSLRSPADNVDLRPMERIVGEAGVNREAAIPILQAIQSHYRYLPEAALRRACELSEVTPAQFAGLATFYAHFRHRPVGEHIVKVCHGTACHVAGARQVTDELRRHLSIPADQDTDAAKRFTLEEVACLGCCCLAPVLMVDQTTCGRLTLAKACESLDREALGARA